MVNFGFNFQLPEKHRYTEENPYIGKGLSRETVEGKKYTGFKADVAEFNDMFMNDRHYSPNAVNKMGLGIDEIVCSTINFSRKNYADYFPEKPYPSDVKLVGNTIKSKRLNRYIELFLDRGVRLLLQNKGKEFIDSYYDYIDRIYNYQIPLNDIASKGKIKKSVADYIADCQTLTKAGRPKSRQAWMELVIRDNIKVSVGETVYYINTGKSKSQADVRKIKHYYVKDGMFEDMKDIRLQLEREWKKDTVDGKNAPGKQALSFDNYVTKRHPEVTIEEEIVLNCKLIPTEVVESGNDVFCSDGEEYNVDKYIDQFNKRITPLLVCFDPSIRNRILITNPNDKPYFTEEECKLCSGKPNKPGDQDTYEQIMKMEDKEIAFWMKHPEWEVPFAKECGMDWDAIQKDYIERMEYERTSGIADKKERFREIVENMTVDEIDRFCDEGEMPEALRKIAVADPNTNNFLSVDDPDVVIGSIFDILDMYETKKMAAE